MYPENPEKKDNFQQYKELDVSSHEAHSER